MSIPNKPQITRLRFVKTKDEQKMIDFCLAIGQRVQIYNITFAKGKWFMWFVPGDLEGDIKSGDLDA